MDNKIYIVIVLIILIALLYFTEYHKTNGMLLKPPGSESFSGAQGEKVYYLSPSCPPGWKSKGVIAILGKKGGVFPTISKYYNGDPNDEIYWLRVHICEGRSTQPTYGLYKLRSSPATYGEITFPHWKLDNVRDPPYINFAYIIPADMEGGFILHPMNNTLGEGRVLWQIGKQVPPSALFGSAQGMPDWQYIKLGLAPA